MAMLKYVLDGLLAHNEIAQKLFTIDPRNLSLLGLASGALNLYLVWKWYWPFYILLLFSYEQIFDY